MSANKLDLLKEWMNDLNDDDIWKPFCDEENELEEFNRKYLLVEESKHWERERNKEKGTALESLMKYVFNRFEIVKSIESDKLTGDNEVDLYVNFNDAMPLNFICETRGKVICECKNMDSKSVDVGMVAKLQELCVSKGSNLGIFTSVRGLSGSGWKFADGKRRKLYIKSEIPIISFTVSEIESLRIKGNNFFTIIKRKIQELIDETEYDGGKIKKIKNNEDYKQMLTENIKAMYKIGLINDEEVCIIKDRLYEKYGLGED